MTSNQPVIDETIKVKLKQSHQEYITDTKPTDVLLGRGSHLVRYTGNIEFRRLIQTKRDEYIYATHSDRKEEVAQEIIHMTMSKNGRFLRKVVDPIEKKQLKIPTHIVNAWVPAPADVVLEKVKQAFRDSCKDDPSINQGIKRSTVGLHKTAAHSDKTIHRSDTSVLQHDDTEESNKLKREPSRVSASGLSGLNIFPQQLNPFLNGHNALKHHFLQQQVSSLRRVASVSLPNLATTSYIQDFSSMDRISSNALSAHTDALYLLSVRNALNRAQSNQLSLTSLPLSVEIAMDELSKRLISENSISALSTYQQFGNHTSSLPYQLDDSSIIAQVKRHAVIERRNASIELQQQLQNSKNAGTQGHVWR